MTKLMSRNLAAKLISIAFAMVLWLYVMSVINPVITSELLNVPAQLMNEAVLRQAGLVVFGQPEHAVRVRITGNRDQVQRIARENIEVRIDLRGHSEGTNSIPIEVIAPGGVEVDWSPKFATIELERIVSKQKEVVVVTQGQPARGYVLGQPQLRPNLVWVEGPESFVNSVQKVQAELNLDGQSDNVTLTLPLKAVNSRGEEVTAVTVRTALVDVFIPVDQLKTVGVDLNANLLPAEGYQVVSVIVDPVEITVRGQRAMVAGVSRLSTEPLQLENLTDNTEVIIPLVFPEGVRALNVQNVTVRIVVEKVIEETYVVPREEFRTVNLATDLRVNLQTLPARLEITLRALETIMGNLDPRTIQVVIDVEGLGEGVHRVAPRIQLPLNMEGSISVLEVTPEAFDVLLEMRN